MIESVQPPTPQAAKAARTKLRLPKWLKSEGAVLLTLLALSVLTWLPRFKGPIDLRWDGGVYYILGTALAEGKGYKLLNEPGEIDAVQYPPLLPVIIAGHQLVLGTNDPTTVGRWLRFSSFIIFLVYIYVLYRFFKNYLPRHYAFLATVLSLFSFQVYFLSDLCFPEVLFGLATLLFILCSRRDEGRVYPALTYLFAVLSYALRTVGMAAFAAWVLESLVRRRFRQAALRAALVLVPILCWQSYVASVESSHAYNHPAYAYQRAPYMFYNVSYARNVSLRDPFAPEKGPSSLLKVVRRFIRNMTYMPANIGETMTGDRAFWRRGLKRVFGGREVAALIIPWIALLIINVLGLFVLGGLALQLLQQRRWIIPLYGFIYLAALCLTPFPAQYRRYLMPLVPFLVLSLIVFLSAARDASRRFLPAPWAKLGTYFKGAVLTVALIIELLSGMMIFREEHQLISYVDRNNQPVEYRLFFYNPMHQAFDRCVDHLRQQMKPDDVVAAGMPHWVHLRTGLKTVMPPFEIDAAKAQQLLDSVPVNYFIVGHDVIGSDRYTLPVVQQFAEQWKQVYSTPEGGCALYQRVAR